MFRLRLYVLLGAVGGLLLLGLLAGCPAAPAEGDSDPVDAPEITDDDTPDCSADDPDGDSADDDAEEPPGAGIEPDEIESGVLLIFHNGSGPMCLEALDWLEEAREDHPALQVEEHLVYEEGERALMLQLEAEHEASEGVSSAFEYLPIMFFEDAAFSGFNADVAEALLGLMPE